MRHPFSRQNRNEFDSKTDHIYPGFSRSSAEMSKAKERKEFFSCFKNVQRYFARKESEVLCKIMRAHATEDGKGPKMAAFAGVKHSFQSFIFHRPQMKLMAAVLIIVCGFAVFQLFFAEKRIQGASYGWLQTDWSGGADVSAKAVHPAGQTGWNKYGSAGAVDTANNELKLERYSN